MQTILGANGIIGQELSRALTAHTHDIRQVSRDPRKVNPTDEIFRADLLDPGATADAVAGSDVVYLVAGLKYDTTVWQEQWPRVMRNTIDACKKHHAKPVFFDNVYAYGPVLCKASLTTPSLNVLRPGRRRSGSVTLKRCTRSRIRTMQVLH